MDEKKEKNEDENLESIASFMNEMLFTLGEKYGNSGIMLTTKISKFERLTRGMCLNSEKLCDNDDRFLPVINLIEQAEEMYNDIIKSEVK